jgi:hypothetical protein
MAASSRELREAEAQVAKYKDGLLVVYEILEMGRKKLARAEARVRELKSPT